MKWWGPLIILVMVQGATAFELVQRNGRLIYSNPFCSNTREVLRSLAQWNVGERNDRRCDIHPVRNGKACEIDITDCVPESLVKTLGLRPSTFGPNCWNSALVFREILPALRYSDLTEMKLYMESPLCRQLGNDEPRRPGDIGAIRIVANRQTIETHGFIYISEEMAYSKAGMVRSAAYGLEPLASVLKAYKVPDREDCRRNSIDFDNKHCLYQTSYHRCKSMRQYLHETAGLAPILVNVLSQISLFEIHLQARVLYGLPLPPPAPINIIEAGKVAVEFARLVRQVMRTNYRLDEPNYFLLKVIQKRLDGIVQQLGATGDGQLSSELAEFEDLLWRQLEIDFSS